MGTIATLSTVQTYQCRFVLATILTLHSTRYHQRCRHSVVRERMQSRAHTPEWLRRDFLPPLPSLKEDLSVLALFRHSFGPRSAARLHGSPQSRDGVRFHSLCRRFLLPVEASSVWLYGAHSSLLPTVYRHELLHIVYARSYKTALSASQHTT